MQIVFHEGPGFCWPFLLQNAAGPARSFRFCFLYSATLRALEELFDRPIEIYSSEGEDLRPMKIDFDASGVRWFGGTSAVHGSSICSSQCVGCRR